MENIYAALLLHKAGKEINEENLKKVLAAAGAKADDAKIKSLVASLKGVDIEKELESASMAVPSGAGVSSEAGEKPAQEKKEEKPKEEKAPAAEGLSALFG